MKGFSPGKWILWRYLLAQKGGILFKAKLNFSCIFLVVRLLNCAVGYIVGCSLWAISWSLRNANSQKPRLSNEQLYSHSACVWGTAKESLPRHQEVCCKSNCSAAHCSRERQSLAGEPARRVSQVVPPGSASEMIIISIVCLPGREELAKWSLSAPKECKGMRVLFSFHLQSRASIDQSALRGENTRVLKYQPSS